MIVAKRELEFFVRYLDCDSLPMNQDPEKIELVIRVACGAEGLWKPLGTFHPGRGREDGLLQGLHAVFIASEAWLLGVPWDQGWHRPTVQFLFIFLFLFYFILSVSV